MFRALKYRNYRLFFFGQGISLTGTWVQHVALQWLVYKITFSSLTLGFVGFLGQLPIFLFAPVAGVIVDRSRKRPMVIITQVLCLIQAFLLFAMTRWGHVQVWQLACLAFFLGTVNSFDIPGRQALLTQMVIKKEDFGNAIALNSSLVNIARLLGPMLAGFLLSTAGESVCFLINGLSYFAALAALFAMKDLPREPASPKHSIRQGLTEGFSYVSRHPKVRTVLLLIAAISFTGMPYLVLMPVFAHELFKGGPLTLGLLLGASGFGALAGVLGFARKNHYADLEKLIVGSLAFFGLSLTGFAFSKVLALNLVLAALAGAGAMVQLASSNTLLQMTVEEDKRGRVMSLYATALLGVAPFGNLFIGALANRFGPGPTLALSGVFCMGIALAASRLKDLHRPFDGALKPPPADLP